VLDLLETRDPATLASLLERRLALVCGAAGCAPELGAAALQVAPARCEVCGGSDIQRAAHGFVRACVAAGLARVRFVGGSPNYRTKLAALFPAGGPLTVHTTAGDKRVRLNRSRSQQRGDDLVIIWGATRARPRDQRGLPRRARPHGDHRSPRHRPHARARGGPHRRRGPGRPLIGLRA
jgi:hypothetical protein